jgi:hypothetical protein
LRAELLPSDERSGLTGSTTNWRNVLVFRRVVAADVEVFQPPELNEVAGASEEDAPEIHAEPQAQEDHA